MIFLKFITTWWKEIAVGIICGFVVYIFFSWMSQAAEINRLDNLLGTYMKANEEYRSQIEQFHKQAEAQSDKLKAAQENEKKLIDTFSKDINRLRLQVVPKDCSGAIEYSIKYKEDLKWPGQ